MRFNYRIIRYIISIILVVLGIAMFCPIFCAVYYDEIEPARGFFFTSVCCIGLGAFGLRFSRYKTIKIKSGESYFIAFICWATVSIVGTLPYLLSGCNYSLGDSVFESISGWTTTGAWVIPFDTLPTSIVLWKAMTSWLGGMGLILLALTFFPMFGAEGQKVASAETPGTIFEKTSSRTSNTAIISYLTYIIMTVIEFVLLLPSGLSVTEALTNTLSTISTAGLLNVNDCITLHMTPYVKTIITLFSIIGSVNFVLYFYIYTGKWGKIIKNLELRTFLGMIAVGATLIALSLIRNGVYTDVPTAFGNAVTQTVAFASTSGFEIADIGTWPSLAKMILMILMVAGGCGNSTSGSIKIIRVIIFYKLILRGIYKRIHPRAVKPIMLDKHPVSTTIASSVTVYIMLYFAVFVFSSLIFSLENLDMETTFFSSLACMTNNGTGFGLIGNGNFSVFSEFGKCYAAFLMLCGRLEFYAIILLFSPSFWNSDRVKS